MQTGGDSAQVAEALIKSTQEKLMKLEEEISKRKQKEIMLTRNLTEKIEQQSK